MFDFFRDMAKELKGNNRVVPPDKTVKPKEKTMFPKWAKTITYVFGFLYLLMAIPQIILIASGGGEVGKMMFSIVVYALQIIIDLIVLISLILGKKKGEIVAIVGIILFVVIMYASLYLL